MTHVQAMIVSLRATAQGEAEMFLLMACRLIGRGIHGTLIAALTLKCLTAATVPILRQAAHRYTSTANSSAESAIPLLVGQALRQEAVTFSQEGKS